ncbi:MAG: hypothetical protein M1831_003813 [Alyxoria varia]|nr:MAG: hypothetical protein M1831_003813 [Alyxoria varia]
MKTILECLIGVALLCTLTTTATPLSRNSHQNAVRDEQVCNNSPALCSRPYSNITHLGAHDAPFVRTASNGFTPSGNQFYDSIAALDSGVRLLSAQVHHSDGDWHLCHSDCALYDAGLLKNWLSKINNWLDNHETDVVTILLVNSDGADASTLGGIFEDAGIDKRAYKPDDTTKPLKKWPTLGEMIRQDKRLVAFVAGLDPNKNTEAPYLLDEFTFAFENPYDVSNAQDFSCEADRPDTVKGDAEKALDAGMMPFVNHFLYDKLFDSIEFPSVQNVETTNSPTGSDSGQLGEAATTCTSKYGRAPAFILVDFFNVGPAIATVDALNGIKGDVRGRKDLPPTLPGAVARSKKADHMPEKGKEVAADKAEDVKDEAVDVKKDVKDGAQDLKDEGEEKAESAKSELAKGAEAVGDEITSWFS